MTNITLTVTDAAGNASSIAASFTVRDTTAPSISVPSNKTVEITGPSGAVVSFSATATDNCDPPVTVTSSPASGSVSPLGTTAVIITATDAAGNLASGTFKVTVTFSADCILEPINTDGSSIFKLGLTVPVKIQLTGGSAGITDAVACLYVAKVSEGSVGTEVESESTAAATTGDLFRYSDGLYIFNLGTSGLTVGTYQFRIDLGDGVEREVLISLR